jgi:glycosyltransferase involved in cell wall biosynthesis
MMPDNERSSGQTVVAAVVYNSVSHDARVLKEAASLAAAGYQVTIFGVADNREKRPFQDLGNGVTVVRVSSKTGRPVLRMIHFLAARAVFGLTVGLILALAILAVALFRPGGLDFSTWTWVGFAALVGLPLVVMNVLRLIFRERYAAFRLSVLNTFPALKKSVGGVWRAKISRHLFVTRPLLREIAKLRPDVLHCHDAHTLPLGVAYKRTYGCKLVYDSHEIAEEQHPVDPRRQKDLIAVQSKAAPLADGFVTVNDEIGKFLNRRYPALPPATVVMNGSPPTRTPPARTTLLHDAAKLPHSTKILLFQGGFSSGRGLLSVLDAAEHLCDPWQIVFMGWGSFEPTMKARLKKLSDAARARVHFLPGVPQAKLRDWTAGAAVGIIPYQNTCLNHYYCSPNKLWEYPVAGVPILASDFPVMRDLIVSNGVGWVLDQGDDGRAIADAVLRLTDADLAAKRRNCFTFGRRSNWDYYADRLVALYQDLMPPQRTPESATATIGAANG